MCANITRLKKAVRLIFPIAGTGPGSQGMEVMFLVVGTRLYKDAGWKGRVARYSARSFVLSV